MTPTGTLYEVYELLGKCLITPPLAQAKKLIEDELSLNMGSKWPNSVVKTLLEKEKHLQKSLKLGTTIDHVLAFFKEINEEVRKIDVNPILGPKIKKDLKAEIGKIQTRVAIDFLGVDLSKMKKARK